MSWIIRHGHVIGLVPIGRSQMLLLSFFGSPDQAVFSLPDNAWSLEVLEPVLGPN